MRTHHTSRTSSLGALVGVAGLAALLSIGAGCGEPQTGFEVTVAFDDGLPVDQLHFTLTAPGQAALETVAPDPAAPIEGGQSIGMILPPAYVDTDVQFDVSATVGGVEVAKATTTVKSVKGTVVDVPIALTAVFTCGDGAVDSIEECDDGNAEGGDGCTAKCAIEPGYVCDDAEPSVCVQCSDGSIDGPETCDDGNGTAGDGCSDQCVIEAGYACAGEPSSCAPVCGDGLLRGGEACDDGGAADDDGCSNTCGVETGWACDTSDPDAPSTCAPVCGDGFIRGGEVCDDDNAAAGDGCSASCTVETGWTCDGNDHTQCTPICGDGLVRGAETCDDGDGVALPADGDGCSAFCTDEVGWDCTTVSDANPTQCVPHCGDGLLRGGEACDDDNNTSGDGCDDACAPETGWTCDGAEPTRCDPVCGDGLVRGVETCDDGGGAGRVDGDGCTAACSLETGWDCTTVSDANPTVCAPHCGDGLLRGGEVCDDSNTTSGDGCDGACAPETGWTCDGAEPTRCDPVCGDGLVRGVEQCDDGGGAGRVDGDGCTVGCARELGWNCDGGEPTLCTAICGDGRVVGPETCDDGGGAGRVSGDGCDVGCNQESGYTCTGAPSTCVTTCGDGIAAGTEACDDGTDCTSGVCNSDSIGNACRTNCTEPVCGDAVTDTAFAETCDDDNTDDADGCLTGCRAQGCGDGFVQGAEAAAGGCDDGNNTAGDGCDGACAVETGFVCGGSPSVCVASARAHVVATSGGNFTTLSGAVSSSTVLTGDTIFMRAGAYSDNVNLTAKNLTVVADAGAVMTNAGNSNNDTILVNNGKTLTIQGLTIVNLRNNKAGVNVTGASTVHLLGCTVGPTAGTGVGVVAAAGTTLTVERTLVKNAAGGGLSVAGTYDVENSVLLANGSGGVIGSITFQTGASGTFQFNTVTGGRSDNTAGHAGGVACVTAQTIARSILFANTGGAANAGANCAVATSLVGVDPSFDADGFHILKASVAKNAAPLTGCPAVDFDNDARPIGTLCDVGADERQ